jgi:biotin transport system substrate-specific component
MQKISVVNKWDELRISFFEWRISSTFINKLVLSVFWACITGLLAQLRIPLPWTPVPITGQTFAVMMSGVLLGHIWGGVSMIIYIIIGLLGVRWFNGMASGLPVLLGPTGGYLIGFIFASFTIGYISDNFIKSRTFLKMWIIMLLINWIFVYIPGLAQLAICTKIVKGSFPTLFNLLMMGFVPFILGEIVKNGFAYLNTKITKPKKDYKN